LSPQPFLPGYIIYLLFIFLPGIGFGELLGVLKKVNLLSEKLAIAFGLGLSIDTLTMMIRTSKIDGLVGIDSATVYFIIAIGLAALLVSIVTKRNFSLITSFTSIDLSILILILVQGGMLLLYFQKYPIFPQYQSADFINHVNYVEGLISGSISSIPQGLLYFGVHYQLATAVLLVGGEPLVTLQRTMALLITLTPLLFYFAAKKLFYDSTPAGLIAALIFTLSGTVWFVGPLDAGLYPNFFGIMAALFLIITFTLLSKEPKSIGVWILFFAALINGYMSHYTFVTVLPAILLVPFLQYFVTAYKTRNFGWKKIWVPIIKSYLLPALIAIAPVVVPFVVYPSIGKTALFLATSGGGIISGSTYLSNVFSSWPFLKYLAIGVYDDVELVVIFLLVAFYSYKIVSSKSAVSSIPFIWFISLAIVAPPNVSAWRFSYEAIVPLILMASAGMLVLLPLSGKKKERRSTIDQRFGQASSRSPLLMGAIVIIVLGAILVGAYGQMMIFDAISNTSVSSQSQSNVYTAIYWLKENTPNNSQYLSVSDWRFTYTSVMIERSTYYTFVSTPASGIALAKNISAQYIIVTNIVTAQVPNQPGLFPWNNFPSSSNSNFSLVYSNPDVRIYRISTDTA
jgi:hypothetical protein